MQPEVCECDEGFVLMEKENRSVCEPYCKSCFNGVCVAPGDCRCNAGFVKTDTGNSNDGNDCVSACKNNCNDHGVCDVNNRNCHCYYGWDGMDCGETRFCIATMNHTSERLNASNIEYDVNNTIAYVIENSPMCHHDCLDKISNETLCFGKYENNTEDDTISCLIDSNCYRVYATRTKGLSYASISGIVGATAITGSAVTIYMLIRTSLKKKISSDNTPTTSTRGQVSLTPEEDSSL